MDEQVRTNLDLALIICPNGIESSLDWLESHDIGYGLEHRCLIFLPNAYEAWKALLARRPSERDVVIRAYFDLDEVEAYECRELVKYLRARGWWVT